MNHGWAYGGSIYPHQKVLMVGIAGATEEQFIKRGYDVSIMTQLKTGIFDYIGVPDAELKTLYGSNEAGGPQLIVEKAEIIAQMFAKELRQKDIANDKNNVSGL